MERIAVLGAGSWGTALAFVLAENGHDVRIWGHQTDKSLIKSTRRIRMKNICSGVELPHQIKGFTFIRKGNRKC